ncbi:hypothetical protein SAMN05192549_10315 [Duganella sacchari]|uniref:Peptidase M61 catalytic domain-containing protein n=1 Tax=Duganella sacchari TaxID=551987 RepID=A0A1M7M4J8_9BURK|nr:hypothetical protein [Duganella sacchari]SHM85490.1 hypothetical protein SAMN05192549_10315 [Duganella sacchari]
MKYWLPLLTLATGAASAQTVTATLSVIEQNALELRYDVPAACQSLEFINDGIRPQDAASIRAEWQPADDCATVDGQHVQRKAPSCGSLRFRIPASTRNLDRIYPWAYPVGEGFFAHTSVYAVAPSCGPVNWKFSAPGTVVLDGVVGGTQASAPATQERVNTLAVVLLLKQSSATTHMGPGFTQDDERFVTDTLRDTTGYLHRALPGLTIPSPYVVASVSPNPYSWRGDVANRTMIRLTFPVSPSPEMQSNVRTLIAHEASHLSQPYEWTDAWGDDGAMFHEGGAEFLRWSASATLGWLSNAKLKDELESAFTDCLVTSNGKSWRRTVNRQWGRTPYACGLAFHAIGLEGRGDGQKAALALRDYYRDAADQHAASFAQLECRAGEQCRKRWLASLGSDEPVAAIFADYAKTPGALIRPAAAWSPSFSTSIANLMMNQFMRADCNGGVSYYSEPSAFHIAAGPACKALRVDMIVTGVEGQPFNAGRLASQAAKNACDARHEVTLNLKNGDTVNVACNGFDVPAEPYDVDIDAALKRLTGARPVPRLP